MPSKQYGPLLLGAADVLLDLVLPGHQIPHWVCSIAMNNSAGKNQRLHFKELAGHKATRSSQMQASGSSS
jgi:hypothetical protein